MRVRFCWKTKKTDTIQRISRKFGINGMTINHESTAIVNEEEIKLLKECESKGYIQIRETIK